MVKTTDLILIAGAGVGAYFLINSAQQGIGNLFKGLEDTINAPFNAVNSGFQTIGDTFSAAGEATAQTAANLFKPATAEQIQQNQAILKANENEVQKNVLNSFNQYANEDNLQKVFEMSPYSPLSNPNIVSSAANIVNQQTRQLSTEESKQIQNYFTGKPSTIGTIAGGYSNPNLYKTSSVTSTSTPPKGELTNTTNTNSGSTGGTIDRGSVTYGMVKAAGVKNVSEYIAKYS
jgi:hypothetical protein